VSTDHDDDEPLTDIDVEFDASALARAGIGAARRNVAMLAPASPADAEPNTLKPNLGVRELAERPPREPPPSERDSLPTVDTASPEVEEQDVEEDDSTTLNVESRLRKALAPLLTETPLEETKPRPASAPVLPKSERTFAMDLPPTVPADFPPSAHVRVDAGPVAPRGPKGTVKIVSTADGPKIVSALEGVVPVVAPAPPRGQAPTVLAKPSPRGTRWGRLLVLSLLAALLVVGVVKRAAVTDLMHATMAQIRK